MKESERKKKIRIKFGVGSFICELCEKQYTQFERAKIQVEDENGMIQDICKFCEKRLDPTWYKQIEDVLYGTVVAVWFKKRKWYERQWYLLMKRFGRAL